eukprot:gnl/TRDRNA2_/TRDRNA2_173684_c5_seq2.p3 gnl/TRDRNA2_/TRDRNA2_173684_c5~~gnl/TRDRNA2_/TRDRNA2_173684_c5_seq2.p3  ORF type:complete len:120 (-),score=16.93 gnl/TRDRNA2_/TRDRNA2_173684_c5_seq2:24-383(-)
MAWALGTAVGEPAPILLSPSSVLDEMKSQGAKLELMHYQMMMEWYASSGQIVAGFALLAGVHATGLLSKIDEDPYLVFRPLLEACRAVGDAGCASRLQAAMERLSLIPPRPFARVLVQR